MKLYIFVFLIIFRPIQKAVTYGGDKYRTCDTEQHGQGQVCAQIVHAEICMKHFLPAIDVKEYIFVPLGGLFWWLLKDVQLFSCLTN